MTTAQPNRLLDKTMDLLTSIQDESAGSVVQRSLGMALLMSIPDEPEIPERKESKKRELRQLDDTWLSSSLDDFIVHRKKSQKKQPKFPSIEEAISALLAMLIEPILEKMDSMCQLARLLGTETGKLHYNNVSKVFERRYEVQYGILAFLTENGLDLTQKVIDNRELTIEHLLLSKRFKQVLIANLDERSARSACSACSACSALGDWVGHRIDQSPGEMTIVLYYQ